MRSVSVFSAVGALTLLLASCSSTDEGVFNNAGTNSTPRQVDGGIEFLATQLEASPWPEPIQVPVVADRVRCDSDTSKISLDQVVAVFAENNFLSFHFQHEDALALRGLGSDDLIAVDEVTLFGC